MNNRPKLSEDPIDFEMLESSLRLTNVPDEPVEQTAKSRAALSKESNTAENMELELNGILASPEDNLIFFYTLSHFADRCFTILEQYKQRIQKRTGEDPALLEAKIIKIEILYKRTKIRLKSLTTGPA